MIIPSGIYRTGGLRIRSNVVLHLSQIFIDAENCSRIELTNVKLEGYTSPKLVLRSECEVIINACDDFELERGFCENACEQCDRKGQMPEGEYNV